MTVKQLHFLFKIKRKRFGEYDKFTGVFCSDLKLLNLTDFSAVISIIVICVIVVLKTFSRLTFFLI